MESDQNYSVFFLVTPGLVLKVTETGAGNPQNHEFHVLPRRDAKIFDYVWKFSIFSNPLNFFKKRMRPNRSKMFFLAFCNIFAVDFMGNLNFFTVFRQKWAYFQAFSQKQSQKREIFKKSLGENVARAFS